MKRKANMPAAKDEISVARRIAGYKAGATKQRERLCRSKQQQDQLSGLLRHSTYTCNLQCRQIADLNIALKKTQQAYIVNNRLLRKAEANLQNSHVAEARLIDKVAAQRTVI